MSNAKQLIESGKAVLGIEFGSIHYFAISNRPSDKRYT